MSELTPTRSVVLELRDEQQAMREGHAFLDEKCLLLAGEIVRELNRYSVHSRELRGASDDATRALAAAIGRHGLDGLEVYPPGDLSTARLAQTVRSLMGVKLAETSLSVQSIEHAPAVDPSPEAERCRLACTVLIERAAALGAVAGNLERLSIEYRRSLRRARALADVLLPEIARVTGELETRLEELEQEDAIYMSRAARAAEPARSRPSRVAIHPLATAGPIPHERESPSSAQNALRGDDFVKGTGQFLGESPSATEGR